jgi:hypothetical protein
LIFICIREEVSFGVSPTCTEPTLQMEYKKAPPRTHTPAKKRTICFIELQIEMSPR